MLCIVDVRECALAHLRALQIDEAKNKRFILGSASFWLKDLAKTLKEIYPDYKISHKEISYCPIKFASYFNSQVKLLLPVWRRELRVDNTQSREVLGIEYRDPKDTLKAMGDCLIDIGAVPDKRRNRS